MSSSVKMILPGASLGVFGGGQLGRMFAQAAQRLGFSVVVFSNEPDSPATHVANESVIGDYLDPNAVRAFAEKCDVITLEFENIELEAVARAEEVTLVRPGTSVLAVAQHRLKEKSTLASFGFAVTPFHAVQSVADISVAGTKLSWPMVLKTTNWGYDGKGQRKVSNETEALAAMELLGPEPLIAEKWITYQVEVSVIVARTPSGSTAVYPMFTNSHSNHILDITTCPAKKELEQVGKHAEQIAVDVAHSLKLEGLLCVEFFVAEDGSVMINEIAPRPHNSGHLTIEACRTSQFEQQVRAVCNLPLGDTSLIQPAAMANLLGDVWGRTTPRFDRALSESATYLHLYGKRSAREGRKMGHITKLSSTAEKAAKEVIAIREAVRSTEPTLF